MIIDSLLVAYHLAALAAVDRSRRVAVGLAVLGGGGTATRPLDRTLADATPRDAGQQVHHSPASRVGVPHGIGQQCLYPIEGGFINDRFPLPAITEDGLVVFVSL